MGSGAGTAVVDLKPAADPLEDALGHGAVRFQLFQLMRLLECRHADLPRIGESDHLHEDPVRLGQAPSLSFAPSALASLAQDARTSRWHLEVLCFGLFGPNGPLPIDLTDLARRRMRDRNDATLKDFADVFHHRLLGLFYRSWASCRPTVSFDRHLAAGGAADRFTAYVAALAGIGLESLRDRDALPDLARLHYVGRLAPVRRDPDGLAAIVGELFGVEARVEEFIGEWLELAPSRQGRLGGNEHNAVLGSTLVVGHSVFERGHKFRLVVGPLGLAQYLTFLPDAGDGGALARVVALVRTYAGDALGWDIRLILRRDEVPSLRLGEQGQMGWTSWLGVRTAHGDADDLVLEGKHGD